MYQQVVYALGVFGTSIPSYCKPSQHYESNKKHFNLRAMAFH